MAKGFTKDGKFRPTGNSSGKSSRERSLETSGMSMSELGKIQGREQEEDEKALREIFDNENIFVVYQGDTINFAHPINKAITQEQLEEAMELDYKFIQVEAVIDQSGMSNHLHVWLHKLAEWEKR